MFLCMDTNLIAVKIDIFLSVTFKGIHFAIQTYNLTPIKCKNMIRFLILLYNFALGINMTSWVRTCVSLQLDERG